MFSQQQFLSLIHPIFERIGAERLPDDSASNAIKIEVDEGQATISLLGSPDGYLNVVAVPKTPIDLNDNRRVQALLASNQFGFAVPSVVATVDPNDGVVMLWSRAEMSALREADAVALFDRISDAVTALENWIATPLAEAAKEDGALPMGIGGRLA